jgi:GR25 family glycosyltransferase involved in LPS biosynthesis
MRIAITVHQQHSFFSAGSPQIALAIGEALRLKGHDVYFINIATEICSGWWEDVKGIQVDWTVTQVGDLPKKAQTEAVGDLLIEVGNHFLDPSVRALFGKAVWLCRKPILYNDVELSLFPHSPVSKRNMEGISEAWLIKEHTTSDDIQYAETLLRKPVRLVPFTWTPSPIEAYRAEMKAPVWQQVRDMPGHSGRPWSIHICETNNTSASSCTIPLFIVRELCKRGCVEVGKDIRIHNADAIKETEFFKKNVLEHVFSDIPGKEPVFVGRQRTVDFVYDPMSIIVAHSRFVRIRPYLLDLLWMGIPLVHNSDLLRDLGFAGGYYRDNEISQGTGAFERIALARGSSMEGLVEARRKILERFTPISPDIQEQWSAAAEAALALALASPEPEPLAAAADSLDTFRIGFSDMWDGFRPDYNMFTLMLEASGVKRKVVGVTEGPMDVLLFGPFGDAWKKFPAELPKVHYTGENTEPIIRDDIRLNIGYKHLDMNDGRYLRLPLWMLEINWFRADPERIGNPKPIPIEMACTAGAAAAAAAAAAATVREKFCAFVVTNPRQPMRNAAFQWLSHYKSVDSAGRLFNNVGSAIFAGLGGGGGELAKVEFYKKYRFVIAYENQSSPGYTTEKLLHAKAAGCVPIYWGDPKVERDFDTAGFIDARGVTTAGELIRLVKQVEEDPVLWRKKAAVPAVDEVRRDMVRRTLSECARRILSIGGLTDKELEGVPRFLGYTTDSVSGSASSALSKHTLFVTGANAKFLPSLHMWLRSIVAAAATAAATAAAADLHVYLMADVPATAEAELRQTYPFTQFHRFPKETPADFQDLWAAEHFAWKLWLLKECSQKFVGSTVLYMDAGSVLVREPSLWLDAVAKHGICNLADPREFNKYRCHDAFVKGLSMTGEELAANQIWAGAMCFVGGNKLAVDFFEQAWKLGQKRELIVGAKWTGAQVDGFWTGHRHDQSILSVLTKRMRVPVCDLDTVYCDVSLRHTYLTDRSIYVHRGMYKAHQQVAHGIDDAWIINLDRRADRLELFKKTHPGLANHLMRLAAFDGRGLALTPKIAQLFGPHDFKWKKSVMGCALSHLAVWMQLVNEKPDINTYLVLEDDARLSPEWRGAWERAVDNGHLPEGWDLVYLGGILPPNRAGFESAAVEKINASVARVKENRLFGQNEAGSRYFHFCAYAYVLTRRGAQKIVDFIRARGGVWTSADHMMCNIEKILNIYFLHPLVAGCYQDDDPVYQKSTFNDFDRKDTFDSDLWNNTERFSEAELAAVGPLSGPLDILGALEDARGSARSAEVAFAAPSVLAPSAQKALAIGSRRIVSIGFDTDSSKWHEFTWLKDIFGGRIGMTVERIGDGQTPSDEPIVFVQRPWVDKTAVELVRWSSAGAKFYVLHLSDEYGADRIDFYGLPGCLGVVRNYIRPGLSEKVLVIPLGPHWAIPGSVPHTHTPKPPFRELAWSFIGTGWKGRREKLRALMGIGEEHRCVFMDEWNSPKMLGREETLAVLLNSWMVPCPGGQNPETFRVYEALEAGAVPIVVKEEGNDAWLAFLGKYIPLLVAGSWEHAAQIVHTLRAKPEVYEQFRSHVLAKWMESKEGVKGNVRRVLGL